MMFDKPPGTSQYNIVVQHRDAGGSKRGGGGGGGGYVGWLVLQHVVPRYVDLLTSL